jgi:lia operon protein LiaF
MDSKRQRQRNTAWLLIGTGVFLFLVQFVDVMTLVALLLIILGVYRARVHNDPKKGYLFAGSGLIFLIINHLMLVLALGLILLGLFYMKSRKFPQQQMARQKQKLVESMKCERAPWVLQSMGLWHLAGEIVLDFSLALPEQEETTIVLYGLIGDVDLFIPSEYGILLDVFVGAGRIRLNEEIDSGVLNKVQWQSPGYHQSRQKLRLVMVYLIGDIDMKRM